MHIWKLGMINTKYLLLKAADSFNQVWKGTKQQLFIVEVQRPKFLVRGLMFH